MRALICTELGPPDRLSIADIREPEPQAGEVVIGIEAAGLNFADVLILRGQYQQKPDLPFVPGCEVAGEILRLGKSVLGLAVGDRVVAQMVAGGFADQAVVEAARVFPIAAGLDSVTAAASLITYGSASVALTHRANVKAGETCLVLGGAGGVGLAAIALAKRAGARVIGAASSAIRCEMMTRQGADAVIDYAATDLRDELRAITGRAGIDVVIDPVGGEIGLAAFRCLGWQGRAITLGYTAGDIQSYPANLLLVKNIAAIGSYFGSYIDHAPDSVREILSFIHGGLSDGSITPPQITLTDMAGVPDHLNRLLRREQAGKVVMQR